MALLIAAVACYKQQRYETYQTIDENVDLDLFVDRSRGK